MGMSTIFTVGPVYTSSVEENKGLLPDGFSFNLNRIPYDERKLKGTLSRYLNSPQNGIIQAYEVDFQKFVEYVPDINMYIRKCESGDLY